MSIRPIIMRRIEGDVFSKCETCERLGFGDDAWHPANGEFFIFKDGKLNLRRCRACEQQMNMDKKRRARTQRLAA